MESLIKVLELAAKFAFPVFAASAFVLLISDDTAEEIGLASIKTAYTGYFWLSLICAGAFLLGTYFKQCYRHIWRFIMCPTKKLAFPVKDLRTGIKQARMRYYRVLFLCPNGDRTEAYQEVSSNGNVTGYYDNDGRRLFPEDPHKRSHLDGEKCQFPAWGRIDWADIFNGNSTSGCWAISER